ILSYLAFSGIRHIAETLGPDHIVYPSLHDQTLVEAWIGKEFHLERFLKEEDKALKSENSDYIASFPNKFVFLCPANRSGEICREIEKAVQAEWLRIARLVREYLVSETQCGESMQKLFDHQISDYWQFSHAACRLAGLSDKDNFEQVLTKDKWESEYNTIAAFAKNFGGSGQISARLYGASHSLTQSLLAAAKLKPTRIRNTQLGEKCPLCGEHEVLYDFAEAGQSKANEYRKAVQDFWNGIRDRANGADGYVQVGKSERLCAICAVKRFLPRVMKRKRQQEELLAPVFAEADKFPSTTEIAAHRYCLKLTEHIALSEKERKNLLDWFHASELKTADDEHSQNIREIVLLGKKNGVEYKDRDKYYALLLMDGDKMGDLINGKTLSATWGDVIHPELKKRFANDHFQPKSPLRKKLQEERILSKKRLLNPALHAAISDALNSFARYGVTPVIDRLSGRLIYAGGDDVCAILPLDSALEAADLIRQSYTMGFVQYGPDGAKEISPTCPPENGKLGMHLGETEKISISAAIIIAHHKTPLREVLRDAHDVLDNIAKEKAGRNALAIRLKKRSGGDRDLWLKWNQANPFDAFGGESLLLGLRHLMQDISEDQLSGSLLYRLDELKGAISPLALSKPTDLSDGDKDKIVRLIRYEIGHSGKGVPKAKQRQFAERLAGLMIRDKAGQTDWFNPEAAIIARFLAEPARRKA
ncbi:MAG TPA: type III-B CRISPR-associated protein Cas10/Cmr2, partial [Desulfobulbaceae bacterium]|nr:type III-B CRISPR-associated protein Cas10/Cmr2 [Desulfobulbaceae bacterium]